MSSFCRVASKVISKDSPLNFGMYMSTKCIIEQVIKLFQILCKIPLLARALDLKAEPLLYARYLCSRDALGLKASGRPSAARDDRVYCIQEPLGQARATIGYLRYHMYDFSLANNYLHLYHYVRGRLQRTSTKISDFRTTPPPGCVPISKTTPLPGHPRPDF